VTKIGELLLSLPGKLGGFIAGQGIIKLPLVMRFYGFFYRYFKPSGVILTDIQGSKMYLDSRDFGVAPYLLIWGVYEKHETKLFKTIIEKGMVVVDVGANIGYYSLLAARCVGDGGKVFAFEPDPYNYGLLCKNIEVNAYRNIIPLKKGVFSKTGKMMMFLDKRNLGGHSLSEANVNKNASIMIEVTSLDDHFKDKDYKIDVVKVDVQGSELEVLEGMKNVIDQNEDLKIITEFWPMGIRNSGSSARDFLNRLVESGFDLYQIGEFLKPVDIDYLLRICDGNKSTTLMCKKR
jgi:FkbM family methyltransferase